MLNFALAIVVAPSTILLDNAALLYDGTGSPPRRADGRIMGDTIWQVGELLPRAGETVVDCSNLYIAPGFIDAHSHADRGIKDDPSAESQIRQGITTAVVGQDGGGRTPLAAYLAEISAAQPAINFAALAGHGVIRERVMGEDYKRAARPEEIAKMATLVERDMLAGALGLSTGLEYDPGLYSKTDELIICAKSAAKHGGIYVSHVRDEGNGALQSFQEVIRIAAEARIPAHISHIKLATASVWGKSAEVIALIDDARKRGLDITADIYPYLYWQSSITILTLDRDWNNRAVWQKALDDIGGSQNVLLSDYTHEPGWVGKTLAEIAAVTGKDAISLIQEIVSKTHGPAGTGREAIVCTAMREEDLTAFMRASWAMFCSDGTIRGTHPRGAGAFPRTLCRYTTLGLGTLSLEEAIRKMTSFPASRFGLGDRGIIRPGMKADLVVFDPSTIRDNATPQNPTALSDGMVHVFVNGVLVLADGRPTKARPGRILTRHRDKPGLAPTVYPEVGWSDPFCRRPACQDSRKADGCRP